jgi:hypothetical protein
MEVSVFRLTMFTSLPTIARSDLTVRRGLSQSGAGPLDGKLNRRPPPIDGEE